MVSLKIRLATIDDVPSIVDIRLGAITEEDISEFGVPDDTSFKSIDKLRKMWDKDNLLLTGFEVFVAENGGKVIGFIVFNMTGFDNIDNVIIAKKYKKNAFCRALVEYVERLAKFRGFDVIGTDTTENANGVAWKAYGFWRRLGYKDSGERVATEYGFTVIPLLKKLN